MILPLCIKRGEIVVDPGLETLPREGLRDVHVFGELLQSGQMGVDCGGNRQRVGRFAERRLDGPLIAGERRIPGGHGGSKIATPGAAIEDRQTEASVPIRKFLPTGFGVGLNIESALTIAFD